MTEYVPTFNFWIGLTRSPVAGPTLQTPPNLPAPGTGSGSRTDLAPPPGRRPAPPVEQRADPGPAAGWDQVPQSLGDGGFQDCSGLELEAQLHDVTEGGRNDGTIRTVGPVRLSPIILKRGLLVPAAGEDPGTYADTALWQWMQGLIGSRLPVPRYDGRIEVYDQRTGNDSADRRVLAVWTFVRGLPSKVTGPTLNAERGEIAIEELHIVHEGLRLEATA